MDLVGYVGCQVYITLVSGFYYRGRCISADSDSITIIDLKGVRVTLPSKSIESIREYEK